MPPVVKKILTISEKELMSMTRSEVALELTSREKAFCEYYAGNHNVKISAIKAGYSPKSAHVVGWKIRQKDEVNQYICWLKVKTARDIHVDVIDILDQYVKIAFADITDFYDVDARGRITPKQTELIDGQIISKIRVNREGCLIELADKMRALEKLEQYFDVIPGDWKRKVEERKLEIMEEKLKLDKLKFDDEHELLLEETHDPLLEAIGKVVKDVWADDTDEEEDESEWDETEDDEWE